jgi:hypothetical protein
LAVHSNLNGGSGASFASSSAFAELIEEPYEILIYPEECLIISLGSGLGTRLSTN